MENNIDKEEWRKHFMDLLDSSKVIIGTEKEELEDDRIEEAEIRKEIKRRVRRPWKRWNL